MMIISEDMSVKKEILQEQKRVEGIEWVNQLIDNINQEDELAY